MGEMKQNGAQIFKLDFSKTMVHWTTYVMTLHWNTISWQGWQYWNITTWTKRMKKMPLV